MQNHKFYGFRVSQRDNSEAPTMFIFSALAKDIRTWAQVKGIDKLEGGTQRVYRETKGKAVAKFFKIDEQNIIATSLILGFSEGRVRFNPLEVTQETGKITYGYIEFETAGDEKVAFIVDGQHRLNGAALCDCDIMLNVVSILDASHEEQAFQFIVTNSKSTKVPPNDLKSIINEIDESIEDSLSGRLAKINISYSNKNPLLIKADTDPESPFLNLLAWPSNREGEKLLKLTALEDVDKAIKMLIPEIEDDPDTRYSLIFSIWKTTLAYYDERTDVKSKLFKKPCFIALTEIMLEILEVDNSLGRISIFDEKQVINTVEAIIVKIPVDFWLRRWTEPIRDNNSLKLKIVENLKLTIKNVSRGVDWNQGLNIIDLYSEDSTSSQSLDEDEV